MMSKNYLRIMVFLILFGCTNKDNYEFEEKRFKDTIDIEQIIYGARDGDLSIKYYNYAGKEIEYTFNDTLIIGLSYQSKFDRLNNHHYLKVLPLTDNLTVNQIESDKYLLLIDTSVTLNEFKYEVDLLSDECVFRNDYPKPGFSSEMGLIFKTYEINR